MKNYIIVGLLITIAIILFLRGCKTPKETIKTVHTRDTIFTTDTVINYVEKEHINIKPIIIRDSIPFESITNDSGDTSVFYSTYIYPVKDSLLEATISAYSQTKPKINFKYKLKNYTIHDTILIKDSVYTEKLSLKNKMYFGSEVVVKPMFTQVYLGVDFAHKKGHLFNLSGGYDLQNEQPLIKVGYKKIISFKK
jgi:hypothetical protein